MTASTSLLRFRAHPLVQLLAFVTSLACAGAAVLLFLASHDASRWVEHTLHVELQLDDAQIFVMRAEIQRRGFVMTGDPSLRARWATAAHGLRASLARLESLTADNPRQRANLRRLKAAANERLGDMALALRLRAGGRMRNAVALTGSRHAREGLAHILAAQDAVRAEERRLLALRSARVQQMERLGLATFGACSTILLLLAGTVWRDRRRQMEALARANRELASDMALRRQAEEQLRILATNATDAVLRIGRDGACLYASPSSREVFGIDALELVGCALPALVHPGDRDAVTAALRRLSAGEGDVELVTCRQRPARSGAAERWLEASTKALRGEDGATREIIAAVRDVTPRKRLEMELEAARRSAEQAAAAKAGFLANMSHEIRTPMNGVIGFTELALAGELAPEQRRHVELIAESGRSMMRLLNDILDLSKIEAGAMRIADEPVDLRHVLRRCAGLMEPVARQKGLSLAVDAAPDLPPRIAGDSLRLRQILLNLIGNAVKFTESGSVTVSARVVGDRLHLAVRDTGIGIPADRLEHVFGQFAQAESSTARRFGGSGLGLSISADLARLMGGRITVASEPGRGSVFTVELPLAVAHGATEAALPDPAPPPGMPFAVPLRILVAEDHDINQELITAMVRRLGAEPIIAADGAAAIAAVEGAIAAGRPFDLVLMDMQMPGLDGLETTRRLRDHGLDAGRVPVVALTANAFAEDVQACLAAGMQGHLAKPVTLQALGAAVARHAIPTPLRRIAPGRAGGLSPALVARYRARRAATMALLRRLYERDAVDPVLMSDAIDLLHKLAGTAATFGEGTLGEQARALEQDLPGWVEAGAQDRIRSAVVEMDRAAA